MKTSELTGAALDWAVAKCEGINYGVIDGGLDCDCPDYSTDWAQGGPIIEREKIASNYSAKRDCWFAESYDEKHVEASRAVRPSQTPSTSYAGV